ncbi:ABC transporter permease [Candidatus Bathyarchaeota archaeon]|nr:ABC transporter permease [Candidatus Bathyarchaeota archaeon]
MELIKGFGNILLKEIKELVRDPKILLGMIIVPLILFPILGGIMNFSMQSAKEKAEKASILVLDNDEGNYSKIFINYLKKYVKVSVINDTTVNDAVKELANYNSTELLEIPKGFSENMTLRVEKNFLNVTANLNSYSIFSAGGIIENAGSSVIDSLIEQFNRFVAPDVVHSEKSVVVKGQIIKGVSPSVITSLMVSQSIAMPITIMILLTFSMQIAATSVAMEKEEKTLETLLSLPIDRFTILLGKLSGSILVAAVGAIAYMIGFNYYMSSFTSMMPTNLNIDLASLGLAPSLFGYILLGISIFVTLLSALALAVIMSAFAEDVRGAQSLVGYIYPLLIIPALVLMYVDVNSLPLALKIVLYAIPFSHPIIASKAVTMGDYLTAVFGIIYVTAFTLIIMYAASRLFATEKILTAKLKLKSYGVHPSSFLKSRKNKTFQEE